MCQYGINTRLGRDRHAQSMAFRGGIGTIARSRDVHEACTGICDFEPWCLIRQEASQSDCYYSSIL